MSAPASAPAPAAPVTSPPAPGGAGGAGTRPSPRRPRRGPVLLAGLGLLVVVAIVVASLGTTDADLDPASPSSGGSRALAQVLGDLGVDVARTTTTSATLAAVEGAGPAGAAVLVVPTSPLGPSQLADLAASGADLLLVTPSPDVLAALAPSLRPADDVGTADDVPPQCDLPAAQAAGPATGGGSLVEPRDDADPAVTSCYGLPFGGAPYVVVAPPGAAGAPGGDGGTPADDGTPGEAGPGRVVVLGQPEVLTNEHVAESGNAALALRTLGARGTLVWYLPDPLDPDLAGDEQVPLSALVPRGLVRAGQVLVVAALAALLWRGRRLGRLVPEPLPVVVRASETVEGRARLYRSAGAREHAAATLRAASLSRLAERLGVPAGTGPAPTTAVLTAAAASSGRPAAEVDALYRSPAPGDDRGLVALADALDALEKEVRRS